MSRLNQMTLVRELEFSGKALFSGKDIKVSLQPAPEDHGLVFVRPDSNGFSTIPVHPDSIVSIPLGFRCTALGNAKERVYPVEHLLAALYGEGISNARILVQGEELPFFDGSAQPFLERIRKAKKDKQSRYRPVLSLSQELQVGSGEENIRLSPADHLEMDYFLEHSNPSIGRQNYHFNFSPEAFAQEIAPARTFCTEEEGRAFLDHGGKGGGFDNCLVFGQEGLRENSLRFPEEPARHKLLDLLGDLALLGCEIRAKVVARRSGHRLNALLLKKLLDQRIS